MSSPSSTWLAKGMVFLMDPATKQNIVTTSAITSGVPDDEGTTATTSATRSFGDAVEFSGANQKEVWFDGADVLGDDTFGGNAATDKTITMVAVAELKSTTGEQRVLGFDFGAANTSLFNLEMGSAAWRFQTRSNTNVIAQAVGASATVGGVVRLVGRFDQAAGTVDLWVNGTKTSATGFTGTLMTHAVVVGALARGDTDEQVFNGYIGTCAIFNAALTDTDCAALSTDETVLYASAGGTFQAAWARGSNILIA